MIMTTYKRQLLLAYLGYDPGQLDGVDGPRTRAAADKFCAAYGVPADSIDQGLIGAVAGTVVPPPPSGSFWDRAPHFRRREFRCTCGRCGGYPVEPTEALVLGCEELRVEAGVPLHITDWGGSGVRCPEHNREVGGATRSYHLYGMAADLHPGGGMTPAALYALADAQLGQTGELGLYDWGIHYAPEGAYNRFRG